ncbi:hypothetical protein Leryth_010672 [Lithospermum erythrorhizon]|nr:hypothetical protein Leryth_010672 [Lithospermum erythrorhizon]
MISELGRRPMLGTNENSFGDELEKEIGLLLREQRRQDNDDREKELNIYRSGSAPPTVEGSLSAVGGLFNGHMSEEELRSDPAYLSYYYSNVNLNPRLPPPLLSKEDWRFAQRLQGGSSAIGDRRKVNRTETSGNGAGRSLFAMPPGFNNSKNQEDENDSDIVQSSVEWGGDGLIGLPGLGLGNKQKSFADIFQDDLGRMTPVSGHPSRPVSRNAFDENIEPLGSSEAELAHLRRELASADPSLSSTTNQHAGSAASYSYAAALGASLSRSTTPDSHRIARAPSPSLTPIGGGRVGSSEKRTMDNSNSFNDIGTRPNESVDIVTALSGISLSNGTRHEENHLPSVIEQDVKDQNSYVFNLPGGENNSKKHAHLHKSESAHFNMPSVSQSAKTIYSHSGVGNIGRSDPSLSSLHAELHRTSVPNNSYLKGSSTSTHSGRGLPFQNQQLDSPNSPYSGYGVSGHSMNPFSSHLANSYLPPLFENAAASALGIPAMDSRMFGGSMGSPGSDQSLGRMENHMAANTLQAPFVDPMYLQYLTPDYVAAVNDPAADRNYMDNSYVDLLQKAYVGAMLSPQKSQYNFPVGGKNNSSNYHGYYGNPSYGLAMSYLGSPLASPIFPTSPVGPGSPMRHNDFNMRFSGGMSNLAGGVTGQWQLNSMDNSFASSLLEEFKSNKTRSFELSEIAGHVVEFSVDQYGSRFIQQKLETTTIEEKNMVFKEIIPQALTLMTDVFGNYVIQKFFEHGLPTQRRELANKLFGHVLTLSLQMYGCRVIQKAIEVVDVDQKIKMVVELDGHVMRCVRDQNGNHVIQKCIECVPEDHIQFIVSTFFGQVITLSTHPYGCRVIQRVLEHCLDPTTQIKVMEEILGSVSMLAQDQYGNYVIQHVLEHGKPAERTAIIQELAGNIVQMSQQKFASNVVEKCLTFGDHSERQLLMNEMLGSTDENQPLQAMMKDQFANYVVQKVLETCSDQERELILSRIKVHLNALKKYTYGKHIVARVEKLVAAGGMRYSPEPKSLGLVERGTCTAN